ncbi:MAG: endonuclease/exonuclease/phosphatase family protein, partial [Alistipes sp.]|nr:endonuclease/exonuclease/phosphatase family protein [Alistipes sp.]
WQKYPEQGQLKIMSFNVRYGSAKETNPMNGWEFRKAACVEMILDHKPTLIGFQEAIYTTQWRFFQEELAADYEGFGVGRDDGAEKGETMGILYRKSEIRRLKEGTFWLSPTPDVCSKAVEWGAGHFRTATWGIFEYIATGEKFFFMNTHLDVKSTRDNAMKLIAERIEMYNPDDLPVYLAGDFNADSSDKIFNNIGNLKNTRLYAPAERSDHGPTANSWTGESKSVIDHVYCSKHLTVYEYRTIRDPYSGVTYLSDHYPIYAIVSLR